MSLLGGALKKIGGVAKKIAPFAGLIPGVGTLAGAAIGGLGSLASGDNIGQALKYGAMGALSGYGGSKLLGGKGLLGVPGALKKVGVGDGSAGGLVKSAGGSLLGIGKPGFGALGSLGGALTGGGGLGGLVDTGLGAASIAGGISASNRAEDLRKKALALSEGSWNDRANLRKLAIQGLESNTPQDLSSIFRNDANPFMRRVA